jgi:hypothetical protein
MGRSDLRDVTRVDRLPETPRLGATVVLPDKAADAGDQRYLVMCLECFQAHLIGTVPTRENCGARFGRRT